MLFNKPKTMNILYIHGLDSNLSIEKRQILEKFGNVIAPEFDYRANPNMIKTLFDNYYKKILM